MSPKSDARVCAFRARYERELRKLISIGCAVAGCTNDGNVEMEDEEMNAFAKGVIDLAERSRRTPRKRTEQTAENNKVTILRA